MLIDEKMRRLRWKVRRGMLELDLAFSQFLDQEYMALSDEMKVQFELLLEQEDNVLFGWILGHQPVDDVQFHAIVKHIGDFLNSSSR